MRIYSDKLPETLTKSTHPIYLIFGNEPLLRIESQDLIWQHLQKQGFEEKYHYTLDSSLNWDELFQQAQAFGLFSSKQVFVLEIPESGINASVQKPLTQLLSMQHSDLCLVFVSTKFNRAMENTKWFKALHETGLLILCNTPDLKYLPNFVRQRCQQLKLKADQETIQMLAQWHEGNLLALKQSLDKLALLYPDENLTMLKVEQALSRHNHFTPFQWTDALLEGKAKRAQRILRELEAEGSEPIILLRSIQKEIFLLIQIYNAMQQMPMAQVFNQFKIWQNKRPFYQAALNRLSPLKCQKLLQELTQIELVAKTSFDQDVWLALSKISIFFSTGQDVLPQRNSPLGKAFV